MATNIPGHVYVIHFNSPLSHARHYVGWTNDLEARMERHEKGQGARLLEVLRERGIGWRLAATFPGTRHDERRIKNAKNTPRICPDCRGSRNS